MSEFRGIQPAVFDLSDQVVVVTRGATGIGAGIVEGLVNSGAQVSIWGRDAARLNVFSEKLNQKYSASVHTISIDVSNESEVHAGFQEVMSAFGVVHSLVNNAGITKVGSSIDYSLADFRRIMEVNVTGLFNCSREAAAIMQKNGKGSILNIASISSFIGQPERAAYVASKSAVAGLTRSLAVEWGPVGIRVNAIAPGYIRTDLVNDLIARKVLATDQIESRTPMRRLGVPDDLVTGALYLLSDHASFVTGQILQMDGGWLANGYFK
jgi:NAD(P)-dependent dehydrogenase (short-subunit alcohol dehydrogenase family)